MAHGVTNSVKIWWKALRKLSLGDCCRDFEFPAIILLCLVILGWYVSVFLSFPIAQKFSNPASNWRASNVSEILPEFWVKELFQTLNIIQEIDFSRCSWRAEYILASIHPQGSRLNISSCPISEFYFQNKQNSHHFENICWSSRRTVIYTFSFPNYCVFLLCFLQELLKDPGSKLQQFKIQLNKSRIISSYPLLEFRMEILNQQRGSWEVHLIKTKLLEE